VVCDAANADLLLQGMCCSLARSAARLPACPPAHLLACLLACAGSECAWCCVVWCVQSSDGHYNQWSFSLRRLNLAVALAAAAAGGGDGAGAGAGAGGGGGGVIVVDSTRKGKRFPDSFVKTIPIWCAVLNRAVARLRSASASASASAAAAASEWDTELHVPVWVSGSEAHQISARLDGWVQEVLHSGIDLSALCAALRKPLRPLWLHAYAAHSAGAAPPDWGALPFAPVACVSVSEAESDANGGAKRVQRHYIQGAADDEANWSGVQSLCFAPHHITHTHTQVVGILCVLICCGVVWWWVGFEL
jgi:tRNA A64-2'-O-ribosylphosphate transferase